MAKSALTAEQQIEADHLAAVFVQIAQREAARFGELIASRQDRELLGKTEFELRDLVLQRIGAAFLTAALEERKKGATKDRASSALTANPTPS